MRLSQIELTRQNHEGKRMAAKNNICEQGVQITANFINRNEKNISQQSSNRQNEVDV